MDDWQKDWWQQLEKTTVTLEKFFHDFNQAVESFTEEVADALEEFSGQVQDTLVIEIDRCVEDFVDFMTETNLELELSLWEDIENLVDDSEFVEITTETPSKNNYAACIGCCNYHGQSYNGQILVCAMHPHGVEDDYCPDWEEQPNIVSKWNDEI